MILVESVCAAPFFLRNILNWWLSSDILQNISKVVVPMRDVINGRNPVLFVSDRVRAIADSVERSVLRPGDVLWVVPFVGG